MKDDAYINPLPIYIIVMKDAMIIDPYINPYHSNER